MSDQPVTNFGLARSLWEGYGGSPSGKTSTMKDSMLLKLLDELIRAWLVTLSPVEIGSDPEKIRLLKEIASEAEGEPSPLVREVYEEVFLQDVWTRAKPS